MCIRISFFNFNKTKFRIFLLISVSVDEKDTTFVTDGLTFMTQSGDVIFSTDPEVEWSFPQQPKNLLTDSVEATMVCFIYIYIYMYIYFFKKKTKPVTLGL